MLTKKLEGILAKTVIEANKALEFSEEEGAILSMSASWHRVVDDKKKESVDMAEFLFLMSNEGKPKQVEVNFEKEKFTKNVTDISKEMGDMIEEEQFVKSVKISTDGDVIAAIEKDLRVQKALTKAKHLRIYSMDFVIYDEDYHAPVWHILLKNWPLTNYFRREKPLTVEAVVEGTRGKIVKLAVYST
ncbi:MAG: hypothetical protein GOV01_02525 [Candidatus Altiarchaeota archaeon]|nr:hypothetical protein [Candidatus Altiarchaeota archaeon]